MPFVICEECSGYYELQKGESPNDFEACNCGGCLNYFENMDDYVANDKRNYKTSKSKKYGDIGIYEDIQRDKTFSYLEKRDVPMNSSKSQNLVINSAFIILTFTIFPLEFGIYYNYVPFLVLAACALILAVALFFISNGKKINTISEMKRIYFICGVYFISFLIVSLIWIFTDLVKVVFIIMNNLRFIVVIVFTILFIQKFMSNYLSREIHDPLDSMDTIIKFIYYLGVFYNVVWFTFIIVASVSLHH